MRTAICITIDKVKILQRSACFPLTAGPELDTTVDDLGTRSMGILCRSTLFHERVALFTFALILVTAFWFGASNGFANLLPAAIAFIALLVLALLSAVGLVWAKHESDDFRVRSAIAAPIFLVAALLLGRPMINFGLTASALVYLNGREQEFRASKVDGYSVLSFKSGIPDGGVAIIRTTGMAPDKLKQSQMIDLVGERLHWCKHLRDDYYICGYD